MEIQQLQFIKQGNEFTPVESGDTAGIQWENEAGTQFRLIWNNSEMFSPSERKAVLNYFHYIKPAGHNRWLFEGINPANISDACYVQGDPTNPDFGKYVEDSEVDGVITEAQFFIDNILKNVNNIPISIFSFVYASMKDKVNNM